jgi:hypothetical protein
MAEMSKATCLFLCLFKNKVTFKIIIKFVIDHYVILVK